MIATDVPTVHFGHLVCVGLSKKLVEVPGGMLFSCDDYPLQEVLLVPPNASDAEFCHRA